MVVLFAALSVQAMAIGIGFALLGAWMILPFAGLEIAIAGALSLWFYRHRDDSELVMIEADRVRVVKRWGNDTTRHDFSRHWVRVRVDHRAGHDGPTRLWIGSHGNFVPLGDYINDGDRTLLAQALKRLLQS